MGVLDVFCSRVGVPVVVLVIKSRGSEMFTIISPRNRGGAIRAASGQVHVGAGVVDVILFTIAFWFADIDSVRICMAVLVVVRVVIFPGLGAVDVHCL